jgi:undecaprenyl-diphosphatase
MAVIEENRLRSSIAEGKLALGRVGRVFRHNIVQSRALLARRRRDMRFGVLPYDRLQLLNFGAVLATVVALTAVMLDPYVFAWHAELPPRLVDIFRTVTRFGKSDWILISTGAFFIAMLALNASALRPRLRARRTVRTLASSYVFAAVAISGIIANLSKNIIGRARPEHFDETGSLSFDFFAGDSSWASFPSGHATTAMALGVALALLFPRLRWIFLCLGFWIAISRLIVGAHYPSDVIAGGVLGGVTAWLMARALARRRLLFRFSSDGSLARRTGVSGRFL